MPSLKYILFFICLHLFGIQILFAQKNLNITSDLADSIPGLNIPDSLLQIKPTLNSLTHFSQGSHFDSLKNKIKIRIPQSVDSTLSILETKTDSIEDNLSKIQSKIPEFPGIPKTLTEKIKPVSGLPSLKSAFPKEFNLIPRLNIPLDQKVPGMYLSGLNIKDKIPANFEMPSLEQKLQSAGLKDYKQYMGTYDNIKSMQLNDKDIEKYLKPQIKELKVLELATTSKDPMSILNPKPGKYEQQLTSMIRKIPKPGDLKKEAKNMAIKQAKEYLLQHQDKIAAAQKTLSNLKKKYSYVPSTLNMSNARKINSLEDEPIGKRLIYGGTFQFNRAVPFSVDLSGMIGYRINKKWRSGITATYRVGVNIDTTLNQAVIPTDVYGGSIFSDYGLAKGFFTHAELESRNTLIFSDDKGHSRKWVEGLLIGIGREFPLFKKINGGMMILYNVLQTKDSPYRSPWQFRFGFYKK